MKKNLILTGTLLLSLVGVLLIVRPLTVAGYINLGYLTVLQIEKNPASAQAGRIVHYFREANELEPSAENRFRLVHATYLATEDMPDNLDNLDADRALEMAESALLRHHWTDAEAWSRIALQRDARPEGYCFLAKATQAIGDSDQAIQLYNKAMILDDFDSTLTRTQCTLWLATLYYTYGDWESGETWLSEFLTTAEQSGETSLRKPEIKEIIDVNLKAQRFSTVTRLFDFSLATQPYDAWQHADFFDSYFAHGYYEEALSVCTQAPESLQYQLPLLGRCGRANYELEQWEQSIAAFEKLVALGEGNAWHQYWLAASYAHLQQPDKMMFYGDRSLESAGENLPIWLRVGRLYEDFGKPTDALRVYSAALNIDPDHPALLEAAERVKDDQ